MHLLQPLVVVASLGSALASPLLITGLEKAPARIEEAGKGGNINPNCPADRVKGIEKLVFESCKSLNISKPLWSVQLLTRNPPILSDRRIRKGAQRRLGEQRTAVFLLALRRLHQEPRLAVGLQLHPRLPSPVSRTNHLGLKRGDISLEEGHADHAPSDFAWNNFPLRHAYTPSNKKRAEDQFEKDMKNVCKSKGKVQRWVCNRTAGLYKWAVKHYPANKPTDPEPPLV